MAKMNGSEICRTSFYWSLKPIIICMKCFGIQLDISLHSKKTNKLKKFLGFLGVLLIIFNVLINLSFLSAQISGWISNKDSNNSSEKDFLLRKYNLVNLIAPELVSLTEILLVIAPHVIFFVNSWTIKWKNLWQTLQGVQQDMQLGEPFHKNCRKQCLTGFLLFLLVHFRSFFKYLEFIPSNVRFFQGFFVNRVLR